MPQKVVTQMSWSPAAVHVTSCTSPVCQCTDDHAQILQMILTSDTKSNTSPHFLEVLEVWVLDPRVKYGQIVMAYHSAMAILGFHHVKTWIPAMAMALTRRGTASVVPYVSQPPASRGADGLAVRRATCGAFRQVATGTGEWDLIWKYLNMWFGGKNIADSDKMIDVQRTYWLVDVKL